MRNIINKSTFALLIVPALLLPSSHAQATIFEPGFEVETIATGLALPGSMAFAPDGRIFIGEKGGAVRVIKDGALLANPLITLTDVNTFGDRGLLSLAVDPNFAQNGYLYLSYTYENSPGSNFSGEKTGRIVRVTVVGDTASEDSKVVILGTIGGDAVNSSCEDFPSGSDCIPSDSMSHSVGGLKFGPDGFLYATLGEGANFDAVDPRALRAQNLDSLAGKVVRINTDGTAPASNPFFDGNPNSNRSKVYALGMRNAFRFNFHPTSGKLFLGDVGWSTWEEVNIVHAGENFGWPCIEGLEATEYNCQPTSTSTDPKYVYGHDSNGAGAVVAGSFPSAGAYPAAYDNSFFFGDYAQNWIKRAIFDGENFVSVENFMDGEAMGPVDISTGPDGNIYYISIYTGEFHRLTHTSGNRHPLPVVSANPTSGAAPLQVTFSSAGSSDPDNDPITYHWNFGDGSVSTSANPVHTYTVNGNYIATLTLTDALGSSASKSVTISAGNQKPSPQITSPASGSLYSVNQLIKLTGIATDPEDGTLSAGAFHWDIILHHNTHIHIIQQFDATTSPSFIAPDHSASDVYVEVKLTVTDSGGLSDSRSSNLYLNSGINSGNLITNPSMETEDPQGGIPSGWVKGGYGVNSALFIYPVAGFDGAKSAQLDMSAYSSGDAKWFFSPVFVTPGEKYNFSNQYKATVPTDQVAQFGFSNGTYQYVNLGTLPATSSPTRVNREILMPANVQTFTLFHNLTANGSLTVDDYSLTLASSTPVTPPPTASSTTLFFGSFETGNFSQWDSPVGSNFAMSAGTCRIGPDSNTNAVKITGTNAPHNTILKKSLSTAGQSNLALSFCYKWDVLEDGDGVAIEYTSNGTTWNLLKDINNSTVRHMMYAADDTEIATSNGVGQIPTPIPTTLDELAAHYIALPADASNNPLFALRIREHMTDGNDFVWMDDFQIRNNATSTPNPPPPPPPQATSTNLILNPSLETAAGADPENWARGSWGTNNALFTYPVTGSAGAKGARVEMTSYTSGDAKWYFSNVSVTAGSTYTLSHAHRSNVPTTLIARYTKTDGTFQYVGLGTLASSATWATTTQNFTIPTGVNSLTIFHTLTSVGFLEVDNYSLTTGTTTPPSDTTAPSVSVTSPTGGSTLSGTTTVAVTASDNVGVSGVFLLIDGVVSGTEDTVSPYSFSWNTASVANGAHTISARARDAAGNVATSTTVSITVSNTTTPPPTGSNLIPNPSLETAGTGVDPANWFRGGWGTNTRVFTYPVAGFVGAKAAKVEVTSYTNGDAKWYFSDVPVTAGGTYTLAHSYRSNVTTGLTVRYTKTDGTFQYVGIQNLPISSTWASREYTLVIPAGVVSMTIFHTLTSVGWLEIDNYSLTTGSPVGSTFNKGMVSLTFDDGWLSHYTNALPILNAANKKGVFYIISQETMQAVPDERIQNPSLETAGAGIDPANWFRGGWGTNTRVFTYPVAGFVGAKAAKVEVTSYTNGDAKWYFAESTAIPNQDYIISNSYNSNTSTQVVIRYTSTTGVVTYSFLATLPSTGGTWQNFSRTITIPADAASLTMFHVLAGVGSLTVDNYSLKRVQVYLDPTQMLSLQSSGHEVGAHTRTHPSLTSLTPAQLDSEVAGSRSDLLSMGITSVLSLAYPLGDFNQEVQTVTQNAGFTSGRSVLRGYNTKTTDKYALKIQQLNRTTTIAEVQGWINQAALDKTWLILMFHQIDSNMSADLGVTPAFLQQIVDYLGTANVDTVTIKEGLLQMNP